MGIERINNVKLQILRDCERKRITSLLLSKHISLKR